MICQSEWNERRKGEDLFRVDSGPTEDDECDWISERNYLTVMVFIIMGLVICIDKEHDNIHNYIRQVATYRHCLRCPFCNIFQCKILSYLMLWY